MSVTPFTHGAESNLGGRWLEALVEQECRSRGFHVTTYANELDNGDLFCPALLIRHVPYTSVYGCRSRSEFVIQLCDRRVRVECRNQDVSGSTDEKFPYFYINGRDAMPENEIIFLLHGDGFKPQAVRWFREQCRNTVKKKMYVQNISEFRAWLKQLVQGKA